MCESEGLYLNDIRLTVSQTFPAYMCFHNLPDYQSMAPQIDNLENFTFQIYGALFNHRGSFQLPKENPESAHRIFIHFRTRNHSAVVSFGDKLCRRDVH